MQPLSAPVKKHKIHVELKAISPKAQEHHGLNRLSRTYGIPLLRIFHLGDPHPLTIKSTIVLVRADNALSVLEKGLEKLAKIQQRYAASAEIDPLCQSEDVKPIALLRVQVTECMGMCARYLVRAKKMEDWKSDDGRKLLALIETEMQRCEALQRDFDATKAKTLPARKGALQDHDPIEEVPEDDREES